MAPSAQESVQVHLEDLVGELKSLPEFLQSKEAEIWLCKAVANIRLKQCGREEIAWLLGVQQSVLNEEVLPSSADESLLGASLLDIGFLPRGAGCKIHGCRSSDHLNGHKCVLRHDLTDGASHASVLVEVPAVTIADGKPQRKAGRPLMIARKNLEYSSLPTPKDGSIINGQAGSELRRLSFEDDDDDEEFEDPPPPRLPGELLGEAWEDATVLPEHLRSQEALCWLAVVVGRLVDSKKCGREEISHLLGLPSASNCEGFGGAAVPSSLTPGMYGMSLEDLGYVPASLRCIVENCNSRWDLNGNEAIVVDGCPDGRTHVMVDVLAIAEPSVLQIHRKNLRLIGPHGMLEEDVCKPHSGAPVSSPRQLIPGDAASGELSPGTPRTSMPTSPYVRADMKRSGEEAVGLNPLNWILAGCRSSLPTAYHMCSTCGSRDEMEAYTGMNGMSYPPHLKITADMEEGDVHPSLIGVGVD